MASGIVPPPLDAAALRRRFPIFAQTLPGGLPVTFLDSAASAQKPQSVIDCERQVYETHYANAYRGVYRFGAQIDDELDATREAVRDLIGAESPDEICFTAGSTMSLNVIAQGWGGRHLRPGDEILINLLEHHAHLVPWQQVAGRTGAILRFWPLTADLELDLTRLDEVLTQRTRVVGVTGMSNVTGTAPPLAEISSAARRVGAIVVVDGAQSVPHLATSVRDQGIDFLAFSGHKIYGPSGVGVLYGRRELLAQTDPLHFGGHMIRQVLPTQSVWADAPAKFEAGTLPIAQAIALKPAVELVRELGFPAMHAHELRLTRRVHELLLRFSGVRIYGPPPERKGSIVSFTMEGAHPEDLAQLFDRCGVFVRHGHHCTMPLHEHLGVAATVRVSLAAYNVDEDVDRLAEALEFARGRLRLN